LLSAAVQERAGSAIQMLQILCCVPKKHPQHFRLYQILIIFGANIPDTTCHQI